MQPLFKDSIIPAYGHQPGNEVVFSAYRQLCNQRLSAAAQSRNLLQEIFDIVTSSDQVLPKSINPILEQYLSSKSQSIVRIENESLTVTITDGTLITEPISWTEKPDGFKEWAFAIKEYLAEQGFSFDE